MPGTCLSDRLLSEFFGPDIQPVALPLDEFFLDMMIGDERLDPSHKRGAHRDRFDNFLACIEEILSFEWRDRDEPHLVRQNCVVIVVFTDHDVDTWWLVLQTDGISAGLLAMQFDFSGPREIVRLAAVVHQHIPGLVIGNTDNDFQRPPSMILPGMIGIFPNKHDTYGQRS